MKSSGQEGAVQFNATDEIVEQRRRFTMSDHIVCWGKWHGKGQTTQLRVLTLLRPAILKPTFGEVKLDKVRVKTNSNINPARLLNIRSMGISEVIKCRHSFPT